MSIRPSASSSVPRRASSVGWHAEIVPVVLLLLLTAAIIALCGCQRDLVLLRPGAPVVITEAAGRVRLAAWDDATSSLADLGWCDARSLEGLTATDYDWSD